MRKDGSGEGQGDAAEDSSSGEAPRTAGGLGEVARDGLEAEDEGLHGEWEGCKMHGADDEAGEA